MNAVIDSLRAEYERYKALAEASIRQVADGDLPRTQVTGGNSIVSLCRHLGGNLRSRFTDFLTTDGEKPWRRRDEEFESPTTPRAELLSLWESGWAALFGALADLHSEDLDRPITIRGQSLSVIEALHRSLAHTAYHVGQIVQLAREWRGPDWTYLSIPPGASTTYAAHPTLEKPASHARRLDAGGASSPESPPD